MDEKEKCEKNLLIIEDVFYISGPHTFSNYLNANVGDLFITEKGLYYISLHKFRHIGELAGILGWAFGGLLGSIAATFSETKPKESMYYAFERRIIDWGVSLDERLQDNKQSFFIPIEDIKKHRFDKKGMVSISTAEKEYEFTSHQFQKYKSILYAFLSGRGRFSANHYERYYVFPPPSKFMESFSSKNICFRLLYAEDSKSFSSKEVSFESSYAYSNKISEDDEYMTAIGNLFEKLKRKDKEIIATSIARMTKNFQLKFKEQIEKLTKKLAWKIILWSIGELIGIVIISFALYQVSVDPEFWIVFFFLLFWFVIVTLCWVYYLKKFNKYREISRGRIQS